MAQKDCRSCKWYYQDDEVGAVCRLHEFHFKGDYTPCEEYEEKEIHEVHFSKWEKRGCLIFLVITIYCIILYLSAIWGR